MVRCKTGKYRFFHQNDNGFAPLLLRERPFVIFFDVRGTVLRPDSKAIGPELPGAPHDYGKQDDKCARQEMASGEARIVHHRQETYTYSFGDYEAFLPWIIRRRNSEMYVLPVNQVIW